jgi:hypothetical protein
VLVCSLEIIIINPNLLACVFFSFLFYSFLLYDVTTFFLHHITTCPNARTVQYYNTVPKKGKDKVALTYTLDIYCNIQRICSIYYSVQAAGQSYPTPELLPISRDKLGVLFVPEFT